MSKHNIRAALGMQVVNSANLSREEVKKRVDTGDYWMEEKLDGIRVWLMKSVDQGVEILTKNQVDVTARFPDIVATFQQSFTEAPFWWFDGEIVSDYGHNDVQAVLAGAPRSNGIKFRPFDLLSGAGDQHLYDKPFRVRRAALEKYSPYSGNQSFAPVTQKVISREMMAYYDKLEVEKREGVVLKRHSEDYHSRNTGWLKSKYTDSITVLPMDICDDTLMVQCGMLAKDGSIRHVCDVAVDMEDMMLLLHHMGRPDDEIQAVLEVSVYGVDSKGNLRHPVYKGLRFEGSPDACKIDKLSHLRRY